MDPPSQDAEAAADASLMSPIPKKKRPSQTQQTSTGTTDADLLGHVPRKKKEHPLHHHHHHHGTTAEPSAAAAAAAHHSTVGHPLPSITSARSASASSLSGGIPRKSNSSSALARSSNHGSHGSMSGMKRSHESIHSSSPPRPPAAPPAEPPKRHYIQVISENPIRLRIQTKGVPLTVGIPPPPPAPSPAPSASSSRMRQAKKSIVHYEEAPLTDSDDLMDTDEEEKTAARRKKKRRLGDTAATSTVLPAAALTPAVAETASTATETVAASTTAVVPLVYAPADAGPPEGTLSTLWYSREVFLNILVLEKVVGWKVRPVVQLWTVPFSNNVPAEPYTLEAKEAQRWQEKALQTPAFWIEASRRMAVSRANPAQCPTVLQLAAAAEARRAVAEQRSPLFVCKTMPQQTEEVLLVKWRGRSHLHCSWERSMDIQRIDAGSNNNIVKQKIKRYYQAQEVAYGLQWKKTLQEDRDTAAVIHSHGEATTDADGSTSSATGEEYFPVQCLELERILACDESEMNMNVLAVQRAKNMQATAADEVLKENQEKDGGGSTDDNMSPKKDDALLDHVVRAPEVSEAWDPEDNVRYVVKWKGLPYAEMTWEYWRDIKRDAVDLAEDFWHRQQPPPAEEIRDAVMTVHPAVRDFKKVQESPVYGISSRPRPVACLDGADAPPQDEESTFEGFRLRSYQLEGVNWLLFNWWNKRSCILADEMGLVRNVKGVVVECELQHICGSPTFFSRCQKTIGENNSVGSLYGSIANESIDKGTRAFPHCGTLVIGWAMAVRAGELGPRYECCALSRISGCPRILGRTRVLLQ